MSCQCPNCAPARPEISQRRCVPYGDCMCHACRSKQKKLLSACYKQPPKAVPCTPNQVYYQPNTPMDANTIYNLSYLNNSGKFCRGYPVRPPPQNIVLRSGPMESDTVQKLSYQVNPVVVTHAIRPCNHDLSGQGPIQSITTQRHDYGPKPVTLKRPLKPLRKPSLQNMESNKPSRIFCENPGDVKVPVSYKPVRCYEKPTCPMEISTVQKMSYQPPFRYFPRERTPWAVKGEWHPPTTMMEETTVYRASYLPPGEECEEICICECEQCRK